MSSNAHASRLGIVGTWVGIALSLACPLTVRATITASGGNATNDFGAFRYHVFTKTGSAVFDVADGGVVDVLIVGGGGGGRDGGALGLGGGGAGGLLLTNAIVQSGSNYTVVVGIGGTNTTSDWGESGEDSVAFGFVAFGGGGGARAYEDGATGGSGGGGGAGLHWPAESRYEDPGEGGSSTNGQGNAGGAGSTDGTNGAGGGGGGYGTPGSNADGQAGGMGGAGIDLSDWLNGLEFGDEGWFAGGGGGGGSRMSGAVSGGKGGGGAGAGSETVGQDGMPNTGGGAGGGGGDDGTARGAGKGGSGIVVIRYVFAQNLSVMANAATGIGVTNATLNGQVGGTGGGDDPEVYFCWGPTDGGTVGTSDWYRVVAMGTRIAGEFFSHEVFEIERFSNYAYRVYATNNVGESAWSDVHEFNTFIESQTDGYWDNVETWAGGVPTASDDVVIRDGHTVTIRDNTTINIYSLTIEGGGTLTHLANSTTALGERYMIVLNIADNLKIESTGKIDADGKGYQAGHGPGYTGDNYSGGAAHGGRGGYNRHPLGTVYGSITAPTNLGSGQLNHSTLGSGEGGGAIRLIVQGDTVVEGTISANGARSHASGSGGSVWLTTGTLTGEGTIRVNGGPSDSRSGGGGRLAVYLTNSVTYANVKLRAFAGTAVRSGAPGTIYVQTKDQEDGQGTVIIDANGVVPAYGTEYITTHIGSQVTDTSVGTVVITNAARLSISNQTLTVHGDWLKTANSIFTAQADSTVVFAGEDASTIRGHNTFYDLVSTNAQKTLYFEDDMTNAVNGTLTLSGPTLDSISGSGSWYLKVSPPPFTHSVSNVTVANSDARPGYQITAISSTNEGGNFNWVFWSGLAEVNTWTGDIDADWSKNGNWSQDRPPVEIDDVVFPAGCPHYPALNGDKRMQSLSISNGASLNLAGYDLVVDEDVRLAGTLTATGTETLILRRNVDFSGGYFTPATSRVELDGTNTQTVASGGNTFNEMTINNRAAPVVFSDAASVARLINHGVPLTFEGGIAASTSFVSQDADITFGGPVTADVFYSVDGALVFEDTVNVGAFTNWAGNATFHDDLTVTTFYAAPGDMELTFASGKRYTIANLALYGRAGARMLLRASDVIPWQLDVTGSSDVRLVDVEYSDASFGGTIRPLASIDGNDNTNWDFGGPWLSWASEDSTEFLDENNWDPVGTPDSDKHLLIDGNNTVTPVLSGISTAAHVVVGGGVETATLTVNGRLDTVGNLDILPGGTITHSANAGNSGGNKQTLWVGSNLTVLGAINLNGKGHPAGQGPGYTGDNYSGGAGHGGMGGYHSRLPVGSVYGSITAPTNMGSGQLNNNGSGAGGGAMRVIVQGDTIVEGTISANGISSHCAGSGGSIWMTTGTLTGEGVIRVNGGAGTSGGAAGGGGRIAVYLTNAVSYANVKLQSFTGGTKYGSPGTIYVQTKDQDDGHGTLIINANGLVPPHAGSKTLIRPQVTDTMVGTVVITNAARLAITNQTLTVHGDWLKSANSTFTAQADSTIDFAGPATATVQGDNTFYNLTAGAQDKPIQFEAGRTNVVTAKLTLRKRTTLLSTEDGVWTYLVLVPEGTQAIAAVRVKDNHAGFHGGQEIIAGKGSLDMKNNVNWWFPPRGTLFMFR